MLIIFIIVIINLLIVMIVNAQLSLTTSQYENHIVNNDIEKIIYQEDMLLNATNSFCQKNIEECYLLLENDRKVFIDKNDLMDFLPDSLILETSDGSFFQNIYIDLDNQEIGIIHNINNLHLKNQYFENSLNKNKNISCNDETCISGITKKRMMSESLISSLNSEKEKYTE